MHDRPKQMCQLRSAFSPVRSTASGRLKPPCGIAHETCMNDGKVRPCTQHGAAYLHVHIGAICKPTESSEPASKYAISPRKHRCYIATAVHTFLFMYCRAALLDWTLTAPALDASSSVCFPCVVSKPCKTQAEFFTVITALRFAILRNAF